jgi:hypothetical protein
MVRRGNPISEASIPRPVAISVVKRVNQATPKTRSSRRSDVSR